MSKLGKNFLNIGSWLMFMGTWLFMLALLVFTWKAVSVDMHYDVAALLVLLGALWGRSVPEKGRELDRLILSLATAIISGFVHKLV